MFGGVQQISGLMVDDEPVFLDFPAGAPPPLPPLAPKDQTVAPIYREPLVVARPVMLPPPPPQPVNQNRLPPPAPPLYLNSVQQRPVLVRRGPIDEDPFGPLGIRPVTLSVLGTIYDNPGIKQSDLGKRLNIKRANMVPVMTELEGRGLIQRRPSDSDRRAHVVTLTPSGRKLGHRRSSNCGKSSGNRIAPRHVSPE